MKVYQITTKSYQDFCFYNRNGLLTLCSDPKFPYVSGSTNMYFGETKTWGKINNGLIFDRCVCTSWFVEKKYYVEHIKEQLNPLLESSLLNYAKEPFNIFVFRKNVNIKKDGENLLSVGMCAQPQLKSIRCHGEFTKHIQKYLGLKAFW